MLITHSTPKPLALILSYSLFAVIIISVFWEGFTLDIVTWLYSFVLISEVNNRCQVRRSGAQRGVPNDHKTDKVRALCRPYKFFQTKLGRPCFHGPRYVLSGFVRLEHVLALFPENGKFLCYSIQKHPIKICAFYTSVTVSLVNHT